MTAPLPLIVTDMDGSLLDHYDYSFTAAREALSEIRRRDYPLILASSKTRAEMMQWQARLKIKHPFICENGAAICTPQGDEVTSEALAPDRERVLDILRQLRDSERFRFRGFSDCSTEDIALMTGLSLEQAALAAQREYSEPIQWQDKPERLAEFSEALAAHELQGLQGGRFLAVSGPCDKSLAMAQLKARYDNVITVALGDSPNDLSMLAAADIAVLIASARSPAMDVHCPGRLIRTTQAGPAGWQEAMGTLLTEWLQQH